MSITKKKFKSIKMDVNTYYSELMFILLDVYSLAVEIDEKKKHAERDHIFEEKRQEVLKKLGCKFIRINASKRYGKHYEIGRIQTFICKFKGRQLEKF